MDSIEVGMGERKIYLLLTDGERMVPPVTLTEPGFEVISSKAYDGDGRGDEGSDHEEGREHPNNDSQALH
jgi:hypothetical protein